MNNLKRVLSLALSGIMLVGMMAMGASAAEFTDAEKIQHTEAVNVLVALKVINGQDDGSFNPEGDVTRAQMAKMIAVAMNGGSEANTGTKTTPTFTDIKGHWAESYIEYCADLKIISGRGDGTFDPDGKVTGLEATKMVLTAMGFDAEAYKLTGAAWAVRTDEVARTMTGQGWTTTDNNGNVIARNSEPKMYEGLDTVLMANNASRDTAAQLIWNGLQNRTRTVQPTTNTNSGAVEWTYVTNNSTLLNQRFSANVTTGTFNGNYYTGHTTTKGEIDVRGYDFPYDLDISNIGEEVKVIWKDGARGTKNVLDAKDVIFGVFNTGATQVVNATMADVKDQKSNKAQINIGGTKYDTINSVTVVTDYIGSGTPYSAVNGNDNANSALTGQLKYAKGDVIKAIINPDDSKIHTIYVVTSKIAAITAVNSSKVSINNGVGALAIADNDIEDGLKKGDVVVVTTLYDTDATDEDAYSIVKKAETVSGEVNGYSKGDSVKVDGTSYDIYNGGALFTSIDAKKPITRFNDNTNQENTYIGEEVTLYMVNGFVGAAEQTSESATNYSLITEVKDNATPGSAFSQLQLQVMDAEGTKTIINVSDDSDNVRDASGKLPSEGGYSDDGGVIDNADYKVGDIITYTMDKNEAVVTMEAPVGSATGAYSDSTKSFNGTVTSGDCVLFVQTKAGITTSDDDLWAGSPTFKAYSIRTLDDFSFTSKEMSRALNHDGDKVVAAFVNLGVTPNGATSNTVYGIVSAAGGRVKDYYTYTVSVNGEDYTVNSKDGSIAKGDLVFFDVTADNNYNRGDVTVIDGTTTDMQAVYVKEYSEADKTLTYYTTVNKNGNAWEGSVASQVTLALDKDCEITYVDADANKSTAEFSVEAFDSVNGYKNAVIITKTVTVNNVAETSILAIYYETSNKCDILDGVAAQLPAHANDAAIKAAADGVYVPADKDALSTAETDASALRIFKFTGNGKATKYTLTIKATDSNKTPVYTEDSGNSPLTPDMAGHYFYITTGNVSLNKGTGQWTTSGTGDFQTTPDGGTKTAVSGSYTWEIKGEWTEQVTVPDPDNEGQTITQNVSREAVVASGSFDI